MTTETQPQIKEFQAETKQVLRLVIHSMYSHKEIFLRELISNASDACEKLRFEALAKPDLLGADTLSVRLVPDAAAGTLSIKDNGVGMSGAEVIDNLRHQEILGNLERGFRQGRAADRSVRRGFLFSLHRRRQGHGAHEAH